MIIDEIRIEEEADYSQLIARVRRESGPSWEQELWFRFPKP